MYGKQTTVLSTIKYRCTPN